jgi:hypothetical protein
MFALPAIFATPCGAILAAWFVLLVVAYGASRS